MSNYIVMQGETYEEDKDLGVIWSPIYDKAGIEQHFWARMRKVKKGDCVFHYVKGAIVAISIAQSDCEDGVKPVLFRIHTEEKVHVVHVKYYPLEYPLIIKNHWEKIQPLLPTKYSAFREDGSGNSGYLYPCHEELALQFSKIIRSLNKASTDEEQLSLSIDAVQQTKPLFTILDRLDGQLKETLEYNESNFFEQQIKLWNGTCPICGIHHQKMMKAIHVKPMKESILEERNDPFNGILLCSNHAVLYEEGLIAFDGRGRLHISQKIPPQEYRNYQLTECKKIELYPENKTYYRWHKRYQFKP